MLILMCSRSGDVVLLLLVCSLQNPTKAIRCVVAYTVQCQIWLDPCNI
jgi:hypothetical protein